MKRWEFLIQHEGHPTWQPIPQATWEGEAGNYRLVAHSDRPHLDVEIHIVHEMTAAGVTHRHSEKYSRRTNSEGLVTILPLTDLQPGTWEIRCYGDLIGELLGQGWQESLRLQVLEPLFFDLAEIDETRQLPELRLILEQDAFVRTHGEAVSLTGKVEAAIADESEFTVAHLAAKLRLELAEPAFPDVLLVREYPLPEQPLPLSFDCTLDIPADWEIPELQGEIILVAADGALLARRSLTIATDLNLFGETEPGHLNYTIELTSTEDPSSFSFDLLVPEEVVATPLPLKLAEPLKIHQSPKLTKPASSNALPPKLSRSRSTMRQVPQLPKLPPKSQLVTAAPVSEVIPDIQSSSPPNQENPLEAPTETIPILSAPQSAEASPQFQQRFLSRLSALATGL